MFNLPAVSYPLQHQITPAHGTRLFPLLAQASGLALPRRVINGKLSPRPLSVKIQIISRPNYNNYFSNSLLSLKYMQAQYVNAQTLSLCLSLSPIHRSDWAALEMSHSWLAKCPINQVIHLRDTSPRYITLNSDLLS